MILIVQEHLYIFMYLPNEVFLLYIDLVQVTEKDVKLIRFFYRIAMLAKMPQSTFN